MNLMPHKDKSRFLVAPSPKLEANSGFTLMEIMVATSIFAGVLTMMLVLFNYTLRIYRRTEALRQISQTVRSTAEFLAKEIRNGKIDYGIKDGQFLDTPLPPWSCPSAPGSNGVPSGAPTYGSGAGADRVALYNIDGERECIYLDGTNLMLEKQYLTAERLNPINVKLDMLKFFVRPQKDPYTDLPVATQSLVEVQPMVTILMQMSVTLPTKETKTVQYQTSVSTNIYNIPNQ